LGLAEGSAVDNGRARREDYENDIGRAWGGRATVSFWFRNDPAPKFVSDAPPISYFVAANERVEF